jgi:tRNA splicing endonuclease
MTRGTIILFSPNHAKYIEEAHYLPPTFIGARRVRPSSSIVQKAFRKESSKRKRKQQDKHEEKELLENCVGNSRVDRDEKNGRGPIKDKHEDNVPLEELKSEKIFIGKQSTTALQIKHEKIVSATESTSTNSERQKIALTQKRQYHQLQVDRKMIAEEVAELKSNKGRAIPAILSQPMAVQSQRLGLVQPPANQGDSHDSFCRNENFTLKMDDDFGLKWAEQLKQEFVQAEEKRNQENMRPMVYRLIPEVWSRLRPRQTNDKPQNMGEERMEHIEHDERKKSILCQNIRSIPLQESYDHVSASIYQCLFRNFQSLRISCGAKFGCDYLLYDGHRQDRHAFAGLRVCMYTEEFNTKSSSNCSSGIISCYKDDNDPSNLEFPLLSTFELSGFVRVLNTAGKLALLALVRIEEIEHEQMDGGSRSKIQRVCKVSIIDLALEKVLTAPSQSRNVKRKVRRAVGQHLSKHSK